MLSVTSARQASLPSDRSTSLTRLAWVVTSLLGSAALRRVHSFNARHATRHKRLRGGATAFVVVVILATAAFAFAVAANATSATTPQALYGGFAHGLPTSQSFFPIAVFDQSPSGGDVPAPYTNQAQAFKAMGVNTFVGLDGWPSSYGVDTGGELAAACAAGMYFIGSYGAGTAASGAANSVQSVLGAANSEPNCSKYLVGYSLGDEPACSTNVAAQVAAAAAVDPTRMDYENTAGYFTSANCAANLNAPSIASADDYAVTNPWDAPPNSGCEANSPPDCLYLYGTYTDDVVAADTSGHPVWMFVETGGTDLALSSQNGSVCNASTNLCSDGNEYEATPPQVNSAAWLTLINGSQGIEWFCDDTYASDACAGGGANGNPNASSSAALNAESVIAPANVPFDPQPASCSRPSSAYSRSVLPSARNCEGVIL